MPPEQELGELLAVSGVPHLLEIGWMQRVYERVCGFAHEERIVDGERLVEEWQQQQTGHENARRGQAERHTRGLAR